MFDAASMMFRDAAEKGIPLGGTFELTPLCNMNCRMCYIRMSREEMEKFGRMKAADEWLALANQETMVPVEVAGDGIRVTVPARDYVLLGNF